VIVRIRSSLCSLLSLTALLAEAAQIVMNVPIKKVMIPLNVTHTAIVTREIHHELLSPGSQPENPSSSLPKAATPLRYMLSTLVSFFAETYKITFGFTKGPPIHDALTIAYIYNPQLFTSRRSRVDIELNGTHTVGETVVDVMNYCGADDTWGRGGMNCIVTDSVNVGF
jgi:uridine nucleosidase